MWGLGKVICAESFAILVLGHPVPTNFLPPTTFILPRGNAHCWLLVSLTLSSLVSPQGTLLVYRSPGLDPSHVAYRDYGLASVSLWSRSLALGHSPRGNNRLDIRTCAEMPICVKGNLLLGWTFFISGIHPLGTASPEGQVWGLAQLVTNTLLYTRHLALHRLLCPLNNPMMEKVSNVGS